jgi:hypothetical protein
MKFSLGKVVATRNAVNTFTEEEMLRCLVRHMNGEWGDLSKSDKRANNQSLKYGSRLLSAYNLSHNRRCWIITDACDDKGVRHCTTILLPEDY